MKQIVVKRHGNLEGFDERKIYASVYASCLNCQINKAEGEKIASKAVKNLKSWIKNKKQINSDDIFHEISRILHKINRDVAFMYKTHRDVN